MKNLKCDLVHLGHSRILVETENSILVFDYFQDTPLGLEVDKESSFLSTDNFQTDKNVFVFASHGHDDHFDPIIFQWSKVNPNISYVLSRDIKEEVDHQIDGGQVYYMDPYESLIIDNVNIKTFGSTDLGVSFLVNVDGLSLFHAGDLNWWHWADRFTEEELKREEDDFKRELGHIIGHNIDVACIPVDPRLGEFYHLAGLYFAEKVKPKFIVPIHFRDNFYICKDLAGLLENSPVKVVEFQHRGQRIQL